MDNAADALLQGLCLIGVGGFLGWSIRAYIADRDRIRWAYTKCGSCPFRASTREAGAVPLIRQVMLDHHQQHPTHGTPVEFIPRKWK